jgi:hypothetical protein
MVWNSEVYTKVGTTFRVTFAYPEGSSEDEQILAETCGKVKR